VNWEAIGAVGEVVGALAVVITLLFLSQQLRQNTRTVRKAYRSQMAETVSNSISVMQNPEFARVMVIALNDSDSMTPEDRVVFGSFILSILRIWEDAYFQWVDGDYESGAWRANRVYMLDTLSIPGVYSFFETRKAWLDSRFVAYVEAELANHTQAVNLEYVEKASARESSR
jgi:hypothetical protein